MKSNANIIRIIIAAILVVGTIVWLAWTGANDKANTSYYVTIPELVKMGDNAYKSNLRVDGFVRPGSIVRNGTRIAFVLDEFESHSAQAGTGRSLTVKYDGSEPPPDTFKDNAQAVAEGRLGNDGIFEAKQLQAKCASKYAPATPGATQKTSQSSPTAKQGKSSS